MLHQFAPQHRRSTAMQKIMFVFAVLNTQLFGFELFNNPDGSSPRWDDATASSGIPWQVAEDAPEMLTESMEYVTQNWSSAGSGGISFRRGEGGISVVWRTEAMDDTHPAQTVFMVADGKINRATVAINAHDFNWSREAGMAEMSKTPPVLNLDAFLMHEMGHALGMNHCNDAKRIVGATGVNDVPTMNASVYPDARVLHLDDIAGIRALYGVSAALPEMNVEYSLVINRNKFNFTFISNLQDTPIMWNFGDGLAQTAVQPTHRFVRKGTYVVSGEYRGRTHSVTVQTRKLKKIKPKRASSTF
jgi:hypothetical protein